jgi:polyisoprenyl-phosphate glycosyltransferase
VYKEIASDKNISYIELSRNFGKEVATTAGIHAATGEALIMIDADMQHPPEVIPQLIEKWHQGSDMVIGVRTRNPDAGIFYRACAWFYYKIMNAITETTMVPGETDFRLIDRQVIDAFNSFTERERVTRVLLNWMGFKKAYVEFEAGKRVNGEAGYNYSKLIHLALHSFVANSLTPLRIAGYLGMVITTLSGLLGLAIFVQVYLLHDMLGWSITGSAKLAVVNVFLIGIVLMCLGIMALYIATIHNETSGRPLYVVREKKK